MERQPFNILHGSGNRFCARAGGTQHATIFDHSKEEKVEIEQKKEEEYKEIGELIWTHPF